MSYTKGFRSAQGNSRGKKENHLKEGEKNTHPAGGDTESLCKASQTEKSYGPDNAGKGKGRYLHVERAT